MKQVATAISVAGLALVMFGGSAQAKRHVLPPCGSGHIDNNATLTLQNCIVSGVSETSQDGGGISNSGTLTLINVTIQNNTDASGNGAGLYNEGTVIGTNVTFSGNSSTSGDGGGLYNDNGTVTLANSTFTNNSASNGDGGGIYNSDGTVTLKGVALSTNSVSNGDGGAIYNNGGTIFIRGLWKHRGITTVLQNSATGGDGGGLYDNGGTIEILDAMFVQNSAVDGAGIYEAAGTTELQDTVVRNNSASTNGGCLYVDAGGSVCCGSEDGTNAYSANTTIVGNKAVSDGGGIYNGGGSVSLEMTTISDNTAATGGGISVGHTEGTTELRGILLARNTPTNCNLGTSLKDDGYNLDTGTSCGFAAAPSGTDLTNLGDANVKLATVKKVGRFLWAEKLLPGSPAIDAVPLSGCVKSNGVEGVKQLETDQLDTPRPQGAGCDIGAFEKRVPKT